MSKIQNVKTMLERISPNRPHAIRQVSECWFVLAWNVPDAEFPSLVDRLSISAEVADVFTPTPPMRFPELEWAAVIIKTNHVYPVEAIRHAALENSACPA